MSQISLQTLDAIVRLQQSTNPSGPPGGSVGRLHPGEILQAQVLRSLGNSLFELNIGGRGVVTSSATPLSVGQVLTLQVSANNQSAQGGPASLYVLTLTDQSVAAAAERPPVEGLENQAGSNLLAQRLLAETGSLVGRAAATASSAATSVPQPPAPTVSTALSPEVATLLRSDGPVARLISDRPDLAPRIEQLLRQALSPRQGLGQGLDELVGVLARLVDRTGSTAGPPIQEAASRLARQVLSPELFEAPPNLASELAGRMAGFSKGPEALLSQFVEWLEPAPTQAPTQAPTIPAAPVAVEARIVGSLDAEAAPAAAPIAAPAAGESARAVPLQEPSLPPSPLAASDVGGAMDAATSRTPVGTEPAAVAPSGAAPAASSQQALADVGTSDAASSRPASLSNLAVPPQIVRGALEGDLKSQLLDLRTRLESLAQQPGPAANAARAAAARTDVLLDQLAAQQIRNVDGLNQYMHVELPVDPKTGISEARMQVFFRKRGPGAATNAQDDRFTVALFLNMSRLGDVLAVVTGVDKGVTVGFTVQNAGIRELLTGASDELRSALIEAGHAGATVTVRETAPKRPGTAAENDGTPSLIPGPGPGEAGGRLDQRA